MTKNEPRRQLLIVLRNVAIHLVCGAKSCHLNAHKMNAKLLMQSCKWSNILHCILEWVSITVYKKQKWNAIQDKQSKLVLILKCALISLSLKSFCVFWKINHLAIFADYPTALIFSKEARKPFSLSLGALFSFPHTLPFIWAQTMGASISSSSRVTPKQQIIRAAARQTLNARSLCRLQLICGREEKSGV